MTVGRLPSIEGGIQPTIVDAKGDLITAVAADTPARIAVGANDTVLTADSTTATGLKWAAVSGNKNLTQITSGTLSGTSTSITGLTSDFLIIRLVSPVFGGAGEAINFRVNSNSTGVYQHNVLAQDSGTSSTRNNVNNGTEANFTFYDVDSALSNIHFIYLSNCAAAGFTTWESHSGFVRRGSGNSQAQGSGIITLAATITSIQFQTATSQTFSGGTYTVWGG